MATLETVNFDAVEILATGGPIHGVGSPPEGDYWTSDGLREMADAAAELAAEVKVPAKIGHGGDASAVGWLENFRLNEDGTKLLADIKDVPKKFAKLVEAKAYRTRSVELSKVTSQTTGKVYEWVVTGLAWLGGKIPAVRTLDDVVALYEGDQAEIRLVVTYAAGDVIWDPEAGYQHLRDSLASVLNRGGGADMYVVDVSLDQTRAIVEDWKQDKKWVMPFIVDAATGDPVVSPSSDWTEAESAWVEAAKAYTDPASGSHDGASDTGPTMAEKTTDLKLTDEQRRAFADMLDVKPEEVTDTMVADALKAKPADDDGTEGADDTATRNLEQADMTRRLEAAEKIAKDTAEELRLERRRNFVEGDLIKTGKITPGDRVKWETRYDKDPELAREFAAELKVDEDLVREYGSDDDGADENETPEAREEREEKEYEADAKARGIEVIV